MSSGEKISLMSAQKENLNLLISERQQDLNILSFVLKSQVRGVRITSLSCWRISEEFFVFHVIMNCFLRVTTGVKSYFVAFLPLHENGLKSFTSIFIQSSTLPSINFYLRSQNYEKCWKCFSLLSLSNANLWQKRSMAAKGWNDFPLLRSLFSQRPKLFLHFPFSSRLLQHFFLQTCFSQFLIYSQARLLEALIVIMAS